MRLTDKTSLICQAQSRRPPPTRLTHTLMHHSQIYRGGGGGAKITMQRVLY